MGRREEIDGLMMLMRAMSGEKDVLMNMEKEGQEEAIRFTRLPKNMRPSREEWEQLGFTFTDIEDDEVLCKATLPEGWSVKATNEARWSHIIDENGFKRGSMFYKAACYDRSGNMSLNRRYGICTNYVDENLTTIEVYFGNESEKLFIAGQVYIPQFATRKEILKKYEEEDRLKDLAVKFGDEYYPDWRNIQAYWDKDVKVLSGPSKK